MKIALTLITMTLMSGSLAFADVGTNLGQSQTSMEQETKKMITWLGNLTLTCTDQKTGKPSLIAKVANGKLDLRATYGDAGDESSAFSDPNSTQIQQIQVGDVITLLLSGPDYDEGSALVVMSGNFDETMSGPVGNSHVTGHHTADATALNYGDDAGEVIQIDKLNCDLK